MLAAAFGETEGGSDQGDGDVDDKDEDGEDDDIISSIQSLRYARHRSGCFAHVKSLKFSQPPYAIGLLLFLFYR